MEEVKRKLDIIDINSIAQTNMSLGNPQFLVEEEVVVTSSKDEIRFNSIDDYIMNSRRDDMETVHSANSDVGEIKLLEIFNNFGFWLGLKHLIDSRQSF